MDGLNELIESVPPKSCALVAVIVFKVTVIFPAVTPIGTVATKLVGVLLVTVAEIPLKRTTLLEGMLLNPVPFIVTGEPTVPNPGENELIVKGNTKNSPELSVV